MGRDQYNEGGRKYEISFMYQRHHEIKRYVLLGLSNVDIAGIMGCTPQNISDVRNSEIFLKELRVLQTSRDSDYIDIAKVLRDDNGKSLALVRKVRDNPEHPISLRLKAAIDLLDRDSRTAKVRSIQGEFTHSIVSPEEVERIKGEVKEAKELMYGDNSIVEAEIEEMNKDVDLTKLDESLKEVK